MMHWQSEEREQMRRRELVKAATAARASGADDAPIDQTAAFIEASTPSNPRHSGASSAQALRVAYQVRYDECTLHHHSPRYLIVYFTLLAQ